MAAVSDRSTTSVSTRLVASIRGSRRAAPTISSKSRMRYQPSAALTAQSLTTDFRNSTSPLGPNFCFAFARIDRRDSFGSSFSPAKTSDCWAMRQRMTAAIGAAKCGSSGSVAAPTSPALTPPPPGPRICPTSRSGSARKRVSTPPDFATSTPPAARITSSSAR